MTGAWHDVGRGRKVDPRAKSSNSSSAPPKPAPKAASIRRKEQLLTQKARQEAGVAPPPPAPQAGCCEPAPSPRRTEWRLDARALTQSALVRNKCQETERTSAQKLTSTRSSAPKRSLTRRPSASFARRASSRRRRSRNRRSTAPWPSARPTSLSSRSLPLSLASSTRGMSGITTCFAASSLVILRQAILFTDPKGMPRRV